MKKKIRYQLKSRKDGSDAGANKVKELPPIESVVSEVLTKYINDDFGDIKDNLDIDLKNVFKKYKEYKYEGIYSQLGMLDDLIILFNKV